MSHAILRVKVVPGSSRDRVAGRYGEGIKIQTSAPPEKGKANAAVIDLLAVWLGVHRSAIELISSPANPRKQFRINGVSQAAVDARLAEIP